MIRIVFFAPYPQIYSDIRRAFDDRPDKDEFAYEIRHDYANNPLIPECPVNYVLREMEL